ncbi:hypothetical protein OFC10_34510, partial [Escherichia coli]|nr:hypothetical protein [Escherichia coli]
MNPGMFRQASLSAAIVIFLAVLPLAAQNSASALSEAFAEVAKRVGPAVVSIETKSRVAENTTNNLPPSG